MTILQPLASLQLSKEFSSNTITFQMYIEDYVFEKWRSQSRVFSDEMETTTEVTENSVTVNIFPMANPISMLGSQLVRQHAKATRTGPMWTKEISQHGTPLRVWDPRTPAGCALGGKLHSSSGGGGRPWEAAAGGCTTTGRPTFLHTVCFPCQSCLEKKQEQ